jgi:hypothetical protein
MTMHSRYEAAPTAVTSHSLACAHELLAVALDIVDELGLPGEVGAHLDHSIHMLRQCIAPQLPAIPSGNG